MNRQEARAMGRLIKKTHELEQGIINSPESPRPNAVRAWLTTMAARDRMAAELREPSFPVTSEPLPDSSDALADYFDNL